jgi:hypothetical protein
VEKIERNYFNNHREFQRVRDVVSGAEAKALRKKLFFLRNKLVFHFDPNEVQQQMKTLELEKCR